MILSIRGRPRPKKSGTEAVEDGSLKPLNLRSQHGYVRPASEWKGITTLEAAVANTVVGQEIRIQKTYSMKGVFER
jgi:hypothetical protein